jgi:hypothetical protein
MIASVCVLLVAISDVLASHIERDVPPVLIDGVKFTVPNDNGCRGYVRALDTKTGSVMWEKTIFRVWFCPPLPEADVWWVLIKEMKVQDGRILLLSERDKWYSLDPKTRKAKRISAQAVVAEKGESTGQLPPAN